MPHALASVGRRLVWLAPLLMVTQAWAPGDGNDLLPDIPVGPHTVTLDELVNVNDLVTDITNAGDGSGRLFLVSPRGVIRIYKDGSLLPTPFLDAPADPPDRAMTGLAFHPDFVDNRKLYVLTGEAIPNGSTPDYMPPQNMSATAYDNVIYEYQTDESDPDVVDDSTRREVLRVRQPHRLHNMADLVFGLDGLLYIACPDGGQTGEGTPTHYNTNAQQTTNPYGSILRIDVDTIGPNGKYGIPPDNPFAEGSGGNVPEIYAWGVRNAWRISRDMLNGEIHTAVVGADTIEQIYRVENGRNYGWDVREGSYLWDPDSGDSTVDPDPDPQFTPPLAEYDHNTTTVGYGSAIGGFVYRGSRVPELYGKYVFSDWTADVLIAMDPVTGALELIDIDSGGDDLDNDIVSWGQDEDGELYLGSRDDIVQYLVPTAPPDAAGRVPDGHVVPGVPLRVVKGAGSDLSLGWGASCAADQDYAVYEGTLGDFTSHGPKTCSTGGATSATLTPAPGDTYYLVVPWSGLREGSYGADSTGAGRKPALLPCLLQALADCD